MYTKKPDLSLAVLQKHFSHCHQWLKYRTITLDSMKVFAVCKCACIINGSYVLHDTGSLRQLAAHPPCDDHWTLDPGGPYEAPKAQFIVTKFQIRILIFTILMSKWNNMCCTPLDSKNLADPPYRVGKLLHSPPLGKNQGGPGFWGSMQPLPGLKTQANVC